MNTDLFEYKRGLNTNATKFIKLKIEKLTKIITFVKETSKSYNMTENEMKDLFDKGLKALQYDIELSIKIFCELIDSFPRNNFLYTNRGIAYAKIGDLDRAIKDFTKSISLKRENSVAYYNRGNAFLRQKKYAKAISDLTKLISFNAKSDRSAQYFNRRGITYGESKDYASAVKDFEKSIELNPNFTEPILNLGFTYLKLKRYEMALECCDKAIGIDNNCERAYMNKGLIYQEIPNYKLALENFSRAIQINPQNSKSYNRRGIVYVSLGKLTNAKKDFVNSHKLDNKNKFAILNLGLLSIQQGKYKDANQYFTEALDPNLDTALHEKYFFYWAYSLFKIKMFNKALSELIKANDLKSQSKEITCLQALILGCLDDYDQAEKILTKENVSTLDIFLIFGEDEASIMLDIQMNYKKNENFFKSTLNKNSISDINSEQYKTYKKIYLKTLKTVSLLHVNNENDKTVAHYTQKQIAEKMFFANSKFRLSTVITANDPEEGKVLLDFFNLSNGESVTNGLHSSNQNEYQAFIGSFTFNHDSLNQFRLYGKLNGIEATGVSLVFYPKFFNNNISDCTHIRPISEDESVDESEDDNVSKLKGQIEKHTLYRCIYIDPLTREIISIGHREEYTFYRANNFENDDLRRKAIDDYNKFIKNQLKLVKESLFELKGLIDVTLNAEIIKDLLMNLSYLTKHMAFKEEQECRILSVEQLNENKKIFPERKKEIDIIDYSSMYIEYVNIKSHVKAVYFAPKTTGIQLFVDQTKRFSINLKCKQSKHPFS